MLTYLDTFLNRLTMYKLMVYGLVLIMLISFGFSLTGALGIPISGMLLSLLLIGVGSFATNQIMSRVWNIPINEESGLITSLILFFILPQTTSVTIGIYVFAAGVLAILSKFLIAYRGAHIFNPAAFAATALGLAGLLHATWWVGSSVLWPFTLLFGLLVVRKIHRFSLLITFASVSLIITSAMLSTMNQPVLDGLKVAIISSPFIFLGTIMLTEPSTMPHKRWQQVVFAAIVGALYALHPQLGPVYLYPELALLLGNIYAYFISPKTHIELKLKEIQKISTNLSNFVFTPSRQLVYEPGQYMEWTMGGIKLNSRGNRRTFTVASSPTEQTIQMGVKFNTPSSQFKDKLQSMKPGDSLFAGQVNGEFVLPTDPKRKLVLIAGGIGITPFRSMLKYLVDSKQQRDIVLFYLVADSREFAYMDVLKAAEHYGVKVVPVLTKTASDSKWTGLSGPLTQKMISDQVSDHAERSYYISGPPGLVHSIKGVLKSLRVKDSAVVTDTFTGY